MIIEIREKMWKKRLILFVMLGLINFSLVSAQSDNLYFDVNLNYNQGEVSVNSIEVIFSNYFLMNFVDSESEVYSMEIREVGGVVKEKIKFSVDNILIQDEVNEKNERSGEVIELDEVDFNIYVPYSEDVNGIVIFDSRMEEIARKDVSEFSKVVVNELSEKERKEIERVVEKENSMGLIWVVLILGVVLLILVVFYMIKKRKRK